MEEKIILSKNSKVDNWDEYYLYTTGCDWLKKGKFPPFSASLKTLHNFLFDYSINYAIFQSNVYLKEKNWREKILFKHISFEVLFCKITIGNEYFFCNSYIHWINRVVQTL